MAEQTLVTVIEQSVDEEVKVPEAPVLWNTALDQQNIEGSSPMIPRQE